MILTVNRAERYTPTQLPTNSWNWSHRPPVLGRITWTGPTNAPQHAESRLDGGGGDSEATFPLPLARLLGMQVHGCTFHTQAPHGNTAFPVLGRRQTEMLIVRRGGQSGSFVERGTCGRPLTLSWTRPYMGKPTLMRITGGELLKIKGVVKFTTYVRPGFIVRNAVSLETANSSTFFYFY